MKVAAHRLGGAAFFIWEGLGKYSGSISSGYPLSLKGGRGDSSHWRGEWYKMKDV